MLRKKQTAINCNFKYVNIKLCKKERETISTAGKRVAICIVYTDL